MHRFVDKAARLSAVLGGVALTSLIVLTCLSVLGRSFNSLLHSDLLQTFAPKLAGAILSTGVGSINGDFEIIEAGTAFTIFAFLPLCQLRSAHASVDIFTAQLPPRIKQISRTFAEILFAIVLVIVAYLLSQGMLSKLHSGQTTLLLQFPVWWGYAFSLLGAIVAALVSIYVAASHTAALLGRRAFLPDNFEAGH